MALYSWGISWLAASAVTSVGAANKNSQEHDRDDHAATDVGDGVMHGYKITEVFSSPGTSFDTRRALISDPSNDQRGQRLITAGSCRLFATDHDRQNRRFPSRSNEHRHR